MQNISEKLEEDPAPAEPGEEQESQTATETAEPDEQEQTTPIVRKLPPWLLVLHNDDVNSFDEVIKTVYHLTPLDIDQAMEKTFEAHIEGQSVLLSTHRERGELYVRQFAGQGLTTSLEKP